MMKSGPMTPHSPTPQPSTTRLSIVMILFLMIVPIGLCAHQPDVLREEETTLVVEEGEEEGEYTLNAEFKIRHQYLSQRSTDRHVFTVYESYYETISEMHGEWGDNVLTRRSMPFEHGSDEDLFITGYKIHRLVFPDDLDTGEVVTYGYRKSYRHIAFMPVLYVPNHDSLTGYRVVVVHPNDVKVDFEFFFPRGNLPYEISRDDADRTVLTFTGVPHSSDLPYFPFNGFNAAIQIKLKQKDRSLNPTTLTEFTNWYLAYLDTISTLDAKHEKILADEIAKAPTKLGKLRAIHDYVKKTIRYIADEGDINAIVPRPPSLVLERGYGDCKDRAHLVTTLARKHGIQANMALVSTEPSPLFKGTYVTEFNHMIYAYEDGGKTMFFDPTHKYTEFGNLPQSDIGAYALILDSRNPHRKTIAAPNRTPSLDLSIGASLADPAKGKATVVLRNDYLAYARHARAELTGLDLENYLSNLITSHFQKLSLDYFTFESESDTTITFSAVADMHEFVIPTAAKAYLPQMPFKIVDAEVLKREGDTLGIYHEERQIVAVKIDLDVAGYKLKPDAVTIGDGAPARYSASAAGGAAGRIELRYEMERGEKTMGGEAKDKYIAFCKEVLKSKKNMFVLTKE